MPEVKNGAPAQEHHQQWGPLAACPPRTVPGSWPATCASTEELLGSLTSGRFVAARPTDQNKRVTGLQLLLEWLGSQEGGTWQQRWCSVEPRIFGRLWRRERSGWLAARPGTGSWDRDYVAVALRVAISADVVRPSLAWLLSGAMGNGSLVRALSAWRDLEGFARLRARCLDDLGLADKAAKHMAYRAALVMAAKGGNLTDICVGDVVELFRTEAATFGKVGDGSTFFYRALHEMGVLGEAAPPRLRHLRTSGPLSPEELIDRYGLACRPVRDLLVDYLKERQPSLDYNSLDSLANHLGNLFWADLEAHNPGIDSLRLDAGTANAWKQRLRSVTRKVRTGQGTATETSVARLSYRECLTPVRAMYLDIAQWAAEDPGRWERWVAPSPVGPDEGVVRKATRQRKSRMDARTRARLPLLPQLARSLDERRRSAGSLLQAARGAKPGEVFAVGGAVFARLDRAGGAWVEDLATGKCRNLSSEEDQAFWAWAAVEVFRHAGVRAEELLELSHHSLIDYHLPGTGEAVPLLQVVPSKTDAERLIVVSPELAEVLAEVIGRNRTPAGMLPLVSRYDEYERVWLAPAPLLFQRRVNGEQRPLPDTSMRKILTAAVRSCNLVDPVDGRLLHYTPHDFRRIFITDVIMNGLPPHIAQAIAGHEDIKVTLGYKAVYAEETVQAHLAFLARRRALRPSEEYRAPTEDEWQEFLGHFEHRKVSIGTCGRAFGTPCIHEHACVRCPMLWPDPAQKARLVELRDNLAARVAEAEREGWFAEIEGLHVSLAGAEDKLAQIDHVTPQSVPVTLRPKNGRR